MEVALVALTWFAGQLVFFHEQWSSGFARVMGDPGAARFIIYVNENWYQSLLGHAAWRTPAFYFPVRNTLGLSDTFLLWQVVYAPARALGADPFLAYQLVLLASSAVGFFTFYLLVRTLWRPPIALALLGAALFTFSNALYANANHPQFFGVLLLPSVCLLGVATWRAAQRGARSAAAWGAAFGALGVLVVYSTYYVGFFAILAVAIAGILTLLITPRSTVARIVAVVKTGWFALVGVALGAVLPAVLFAVTFLPALRSAGGYKLQSANYFAPQLLDLVNVGVGNLLWGTSLVRGAVHGTASLSERDYAITPILLLVTLVAVVLATVRERRDVQKVDRRYSPMILAATGVIMLVLPMSSGNNVDTQHSLWRAVYWIPGASGIRAIDRISVVAAGMLVLALIDAGARLYPWLRARLPAPVLIAGFSVVALGLPRAGQRDQHVAHLAPGPARAPERRGSAAERVCKLLRGVDHGVAAAPRPGPDHRDAAERQVRDPDPQRHERLVPEGLAPVLPHAPPGGALGPGVLRWRQQLDRRQAPDARLRAQPRHQPMVPLRGAGHPVTRRTWRTGRGGRAPGVRTPTTFSGLRTSLYSSSPNASAHHHTRLAAPGPSGRPAAAAVTTTRALRVAVATPSYPPELGGLGQHVRSLATALAGAGCEATVLTQVRGDLPVPSGRSESEHLKVVRFKSQVGGRRFGYAPRLRRYAHEHRGDFDVVHALSTTRRSRSR